MKWKTWLIHLAFWAFYVLSEYLANLMHLRSEYLFDFFRATFLSLPILMLATYSMAWWAVPRLLQRGKNVAFILVLLAVMAFVFWSRIQWLHFINYLENGSFFQIPPSKVLKNVIRDYSIIALAVCLHIIADWRNQQRLNEQLVKAKAEAEIKLLKGQLHPHFLFNSLNNIYSLALMQSDQTADSILKLTELLDYLIYKANLEKVELSKELELLRNYIELERLRYDETLRLDMNLNIENEAIRVTPLLLLPFAENCFKHGGKGEDGIFHINISLSINQQILDFYIQNSKKQKAKKEASNGGLGLKNIQKRLRLLYPNQHQLNIEETDAFYSVRLFIQF